MKDMNFWHASRSWMGPFKISVLCHYEHVPYKFHVFHILRNIQVKPYVRLYATEALVVRYVEVNLYVCQ